METAELLKVRHEGPVAEIVGRIQDVDLPADKKSQKTGKDELCQDVVIELPDRTKVVIAFWEMSSRCFSRSGKLSDLLVFNRECLGFWIKVRDTNPREHHSLSRRTQGKAPRHYVEKRGVPVYLKATPTVSVEWLLEKGQTAPVLGPPRRVKKPKPLQVPGSQNAGGATTMGNSESEGGVPGARRGTNTGGSVDRRPPAEQQRRDPAPQGAAPQGAAPPADKPKTATDTKGIPPDEAWEKRFEKSAHMASLVQRRAEQALIGHYIDAKLHVSDAFISEAVKTIETQLSHFKGPLERGNTSLTAVKPEKLAFIIKALAKSYFVTHTMLLKVYEKEAATLTQDEVGLRTRITTAWITALQDSPLILPR